MPSTFQISKFDPATARNMSCVLVIGRRSTGKTVIAKELLKVLNCPKNVVIDSLAETLEYAEIVPKENIHANYAEEIVDDFVNDGRQHRNDQRQDRCIVFDNCFFNNHWHRHRSMRMLSMNGRCIRAKQIITMSYPMSLPPDFRTNVDYVVIFRENNEAHRKRLYEQYAGIFPTFEVFCQVLDQLTAEPFSCMVINNTAPSNRLEDQVMFYVAVPPWREMVEKKKALLEVIREELMQKAWHPTRLKSCLSHDEVREIFSKTTPCLRELWRS